MCGHLAGTTRGARVSKENYISQFLEQFKGFDFTHYPMLCVYNSGSFLNPDEIDPETRRVIMEIIASEKAIRVIIFESRPEFITQEVIAEMEQVLGDRTVEIGIGLETQRDEIREVCINKGFSTQEYLRAAELIADSSLHLLTYILVKPPFLTEREAIEDAVETAQFAFQHGTDVISFEPVSVQDFTLIHYLHEGKAFRPPWIWSVIEIAKATAHLGFIRLGGFEFMPIPKIFTHNCDKCNALMVGAINTFNSTYDLTCFDNMDCSCKDQWRHEVEQQTPPLYDRINQILDKLNEEEILKRMLGAYEWRGITPVFLEYTPHCGGHLIELVD